MQKAIGAARAFENALVVKFATYAIQGCTAVPCSISRNRVRCRHRTVTKGVAHLADIHVGLGQFNAEGVAQHMRGAINTRGGLTPR